MKVTTGGSKSLADINHARSGDVGGCENLCCALCATVLANLGHHTLPNGNETVGDGRQLSLAHLLLLQQVCRDYTGLANDGYCNSKGYYPTSKFTRSTRHSMCSSSSSLSSSMDPRYISARWLFCYTMTLTIKPVHKQSCSPVRCMISK
jgi:hypothetical protein